MYGSTCTAVPGSRKPGVQTCSTVNKTLGVGRRSPQPRCWVSQPIPIAVNLEGKMRPLPEPQSPATPPSQSPGGTAVPLPLLVVPATAQPFPGFLKLATSIQDPGEWSWTRTQLFIS